MGTRRLAIVGIWLALVAAVTGCNVDVSDGPTTGPTTTAEATPSETAPATPTTASTPTRLAPPPPGYPGNAKAYAEAILAAWKAKQINRIGDLTTALVQDQIISIPGPPNQDWTHVRCDGAAGSTYCVFVNNVGDVITLRILNSNLGEAHAGTEVKFDQTEYPSDAKQYVEAFVEAWRNANTKRMLALSNQAGVDYFTPYVPPTTYTVCSRLVGTTWQVRIHNSAGVNYLVRIADSARGKPHAITNPGIAALPPVCA